MNPVHMAVQKNQPILVIHPPVNESVGVGPVWAEPAGAKHGFVVRAWREKSEIFLRKLRGKRSGVGVERKFFP